MPTLFGDAPLQQSFASTKSVDVVNGAVTKIIMTAVIVWKAFKVSNSSLVSILSMLFKENKNR